VESHLRDLLEQGFEVAVVRDATAGPRHPTRGDGYRAALVNYAFLAHAVPSTAEAVAAMATESPHVPHGAAALASKAE
jgi:nicotinamidase-related amidase